MNLKNIGIQAMSKLTKQTPQQVEQALSQVQKVAQRVNSVDSARKVLNEQGISNNFIDDAFNKVSPLIDKYGSLVGIDKQSVSKQISELKGENVVRKTTNTSIGKFPKLK